MENIFTDELFTNTYRDANVVPVVDGILNSIKSAYENITAIDDKEDVEFVIAVLNYSFKFKMEFSYIESIYNNIDAIENYIHGVVLNMKNNLTV